MSKRFELGVLFVHGIGNQKRGDTLLRFGGPLQQAIRDRLGIAADRARKKHKKLPTLKVRHVAFGESPEDSFAPAHAELSLNNIADFRTDKSTAQPQSRWLFAEAWWAESFPTPTYGELCAWGVDILPRILVGHFDRRFRRSWFRISQSATRGELLRNCFTWGAEFFTLAVALLFAPVLVGLVLGMLVVGWIPVPWLQTFVGKVQRWLAGLVGDSYVLVGQPISEGAIVTTLRRNLEWLVERCDRVAVIAHSQGAAIAHDVIRSNPLIHCDLLVTFGSGVSKLSDVRESADTSKQLLLWGTSALFWFAAICPLGLLFVNPRYVLAVAAISVLLFLCGILTLRGWRRATGRHVDRERQWLDDRRKYTDTFRLPHHDRVDWVDLYASADPVPNGPLMDDYLPREMHTREVQNRHSIITDHNSYWENRDDFVSRISWDLLEKAGISPQKIERRGGDRQTVSSVRREWRIACLVYLRYAVAITSLLLFLAWSCAPPEYATQLVQLSRSLLIRIPSLGEWMVGAEDVRVFSVVGAVTFLVLAFGWYLALFFVWWLWDRCERNVRYTRLLYGFFDIRFLVFLLSVSLSVGGIVGVICWQLTGIGGLMLLGVVMVFLLLALTVDLFGMRTRLLALSASGYDWKVLERLENLWQLRLEAAADKGLAWAAFDLGRRLQRLGRPVAAEAAWQKAIDLESGDAAFALGTYYEQKFDSTGNVNDRRRAIIAYDKGTKCGDASCAWFLGGLLEKSGSEKLAIAAYKLGAYKLDPPSPNCAQNLGWLLRKSDPDGAKKAYRTGMAIGDVGSITGLGSMLQSEAKDWKYKHNDHDRADQCLREASVLFRTGIELGSGDAAAELGNVLRELGDVEGAREAYSSGVQLRNSNAAFELGRLLEEENEPDAAMAAYRKCLEFDSRSYEAEAGLGRLLEQQNHVRAAIRSYKRAIGAPGESHGSAEAAVRLGRLRLQEEDGENRAIEAFERGVELESPESALELGRLFAKRWHRDEATAMYIKSVELGWDEEREALLEFLESETPYFDRDAVRQVCDSEIKWHSERNLIRFGKLLAKAGENEKAKSLLGDIKYSADAAMELGHILENEGDQAGAFAEYKRARTQL